MTRILAIDYGRKRIGLAIADPSVRIALPHQTLAGRNDVTRDARAVADEGEAQQADTFVVGLPLNMDGTDSEQTALTRRFAAELQRLSNKPVHFHDERLSSYAAEEVLNESDLTRGKRRDLIDQIAAQKILQSYLDAVPPPL